MLPGCSSGATDGLRNGDAVLQQKSGACYRPGDG